MGNSSWSFRPIPKPMSIFHDENKITINGNSFEEFKFPIFPTSSSLPKIPPFRLRFKVRTIGYDPLFLFNNAIFYYYILLKIFLLFCPSCSRANGIMKSADCIPPRRNNNAIRLTMKLAADIIKLMAARWAPWIRNEHARRVDFPSSYRDKYFHRFLLRLSVQRLRIDVTDRGLL